MPAPQASVMQQFARAQFTSFALTVPTNWQDPQGDPAAGQYSQAFKDSEKTTSPGSPPLFLAATMNKYHTDTQKMLIAKIGSFLDTTCSAICSAWSQWQTAATFAEMFVNGPAINGGVLVGPPWAPVIIAEGAVSTPNLMKFTTVIANVIGQAWLTYTSPITIAAPFTSHPMMAMWAAPSVPAPIPNEVPIPWSSLLHIPTLLEAPLLKSQMIAQLGDPQAPFAPQIFDAICTAFSQCFTTWMSTTMLNNVICVGGACPTMSTPIPVPGPIVMALAQMLPGGIT
jgi:hypothetical protein